MDRTEYSRLQEKLSQHLARIKAVNKTNQIPSYEWMTAAEIRAYEKAILAAKSILSTDQKYGA